MNLIMWEIARQRRSVHQDILFGWMKHTETFTVSVKSISYQPNQEQNRMGRKELTRHKRQNESEFRTVVDESLRSNVEPKRSKTLF